MNQSEFLDAMAVATVCASSEDLELILCVAEATASFRRRQRDTLPCPALEPPPEDAPRLTGPDRGLHG